MKIKNSNTPRIWLNGAHFINDIYTGMLNPIMPFIAVKLSISMGVATVILSLSHICASLLQPIFGFFADNILKRIFIFWGLMMSAMFISFAPNVNSILLLLIFIILGSLGSSLFHPQALGFSVRFSSNQPTKNMGIFIGFGTFGFSLGPIASAYVTQFLGLDRMPYLAIFGIIWALMMFAFIPKIEQGVMENSNKEFITAFKDILTCHKLNILNIIAVLKSLVWTSCTILLPFLWKNLGYKPFYIGVALFLFTFLSGIASFVSRLVESKIGTKKVFYISMLSPLPAMILFALTYQNHPIASLIIFVLTGFFTGLAVPITMVMAQNTLPQYKSIIGGFINGFSWGVVAIAMSIIGFVAQTKGIIPVLVTICTIPAICSNPILNKLFTQDNQ